MGAPVAASRVLYRYTGVVAASIVAAKARGARAAWPMLGRLLLPPGRARDLDAVTWVPADARRRRRRGIDHAEVLAAGLARRLGRPAVALLTAAARPQDQTERPLSVRRRLDPATFAARGALPPVRLLLVDDVLTTGATATVAATALRRAGAAEVSLSVLARAGQHRLGADVAPSR